MNNLYDPSEPSEAETPTAFRVNSMQPPDSNICAPVVAERARRKEVDAEFGRRLSRIERRAGGIEKRVNVVLGALAFMVAAASLEYAGIIGKNIDHTVWSHAIFDGVKYALLGK